jgi:hypothetical protein
MAWQDDPVLNPADLAAYGQQRLQQQPQQQDDAASRLVAYGRQQVGQQAPQGGYQQDPVEELPWSQVPGQALRNVIPSAARFGHDIIQPIMHPVETAQNIGNVGSGVAQKLGLKSGDEDTKYADAVGQYFSGRYGSMEGFKRALATDPVGVAGDISTLFSGGETALARAPGILGRAGEIAGTAARLTDPVNLAGQAAKGAIKATTPFTGVTTGAGGMALREAFGSGLEGGEAARAFRENMRGQVPASDVVDQAAGAVRTLKDERNADYQRELRRTQLDRTILNFNKIDTATDDANNIVRNRFGVPKNLEGARAVDEAENLVSQWKNLRASQHWTPEGFDTLKQRIGEIRDRYQPGSQAHTALGQIYNGVKNTIVDQVPFYQPMMEGYSDATRQIKDIEKTLSTTPNASIDTSLRKLQATMRNNASTTYGRRVDMVRMLEEVGAPNLMRRLAGQTLNTWEPRGLARATAVIGAHALPGILASGPASPLAALGVGAGLAATSPRLMGEGYYLGGRAGAGLSQAAPLATPLRQIGRQNDQQRLYVSPQR